MNEAEFRDWTRGQLRSLDERLKAVAARPDAPAAKATLERLTKDKIEELAGALTAAVREGAITGLGIVFITADGVPHSGYVPGEAVFPLAGATTLMSLEILEEFRKVEVADAGKPA